MADGLRTKLRAPVCGTVSAYVTGCRCDPCTAANTTYHREYRRTVRRLARARWAAHRRRTGVRA